MMKNMSQMTNRIGPPLIALILAVILFFSGGLIRSGFVSYAQAINIVRLASFLGIIAAGQTIVIISGGEGIDLSVGAVVTLSAILVYRYSDGQNLLILPALLLALAVGAGVGSLNGLGIAFLGIPPLIMTLAMAGVVEGLILIVTQGQFIGDVPPAMTAYISNPLVFRMPGVIFLWMLLALGMWLLLERTAFGKHLFAIGVNRTTARLSGVGVDLTVILAYALSGMLAAFGGFTVLAFAQNVFLRLGDRYLFPSIAAVVVGGTILAGGKGSYFGTISGALVLTLITSLLTAMQLPEAYRQIILGATLLVLISVYGRQRALRE
jgi:ribose transport system permease protein